VPDIDYINSFIKGLLTDRANIVVYGRQPSEREREEERGGGGERERARESETDIESQSKSERARESVTDRVNTVIHGCEPAAPRHVSAYLRPCETHALKEAVGVTFEARACSLRPPTLAA
jgi:hypothetical protein